MFEFHGWATIRASAGCEDDDGADHAQRAAESTVREMVAGSPLRESFNCTLDIRTANGHLHLSLAGCHNHADARVLYLFHDVARLAPGSYGLLYIHDDEDPERDTANRWTSHVLARGAVTAVPDPFLSPIIEVVEDDCG